MLTPAESHDTDETGEVSKYCPQASGTRPAIRGQADQTSGVDYSLPDAEQDLSDHFPLLAVFADTATSPAGGTTSSVSRAQLLEAITRIEHQLQELQRHVDAVKDLIQELPN